MKIKNDWMQQQRLVKCYGKQIVLQYLVVEKDLIGLINYQEDLI
jgi:hypothetical protein